MRCVQQFEVEWLHSLPLSNAPLIVDVGANDGEYTDAVLQQWPKAQVVCFEPNPNSVAALGKRLEDRLAIANVSVVPAAVSSEGGAALLYFDGAEADLTASLHRRDLSYQGQAHGSNCVPVEKVTLERYIEQGLGPIIDVLKIDVEGHELAVLRGAGDYLDPTYIHRIQFEFNSCALDSRVFFKDFWDLLTARNYRLFKMEPDGLHVIDAYKPTLEDFAAQRDFVALGPDYI